MVFLLMNEWMEKWINENLQLLWGEFKNVNDIAWAVALQQRFTITTASTRAT